MLATQVGKSLYPPTVAVLAAAGASLELQYRVMMGVCPFFCVAGWVALSLRRKRSALAPVPPPPTPTSLAPAPELAPPLKQEVGAAKGGQSGGASAWPPVFVATAAAIAATAAARQSGAVLWPLYLRDGFEWGAAQFAGALLAENLASIGALFFLPRVAQHYGAAAVAVGGLASAAACAALAFRLRSPPMHVACMARFAGRPARTAYTRPTRLARLVRCASSPACRSSMRTCAPLVPSPRRRRCRASLR